MKNQTILLVTSITIIIGVALLFLGIITYLDPGYTYAMRAESRTRAYVEIAIGFIFIAIGAVVFLIYGDIQATRKLLVRSRHYEKP